MKGIIQMIVSISFMLILMCSCDKEDDLPTSPMTIELDGVSYDGAQSVAPFWFTADGNTFSFIFHNYILRSDSGEKLYLSFRLMYSEPFELGKVYELPSGQSMTYVNLYYYDENGELHDCHVKDGWLRFIMGPPELSGEFEFMAVDSERGTICHVTKGVFDLTVEYV